MSSRFSFCIYRNSLAINACVNCLLEKRNIIFLVVKYFLLIVFTSFINSKTFFMLIHFTEPNQSRILGLYVTKGQ